MWLCQACIVEYIGLRGHPNLEEFRLRLLPLHHVYRLVYADGEVYSGTGSYKVAYLSWCLEVLRSHTRVFEARASSSGYGQTYCKGEAVRCRNEVSRRARRQSVARMPDNPRLRYCCLPYPISVHKSLNSGDTYQNSVYIDVVTIGE